MRDDEVTRRDALSLLWAGSVVMLAGCAGSSEQNQDQVDFGQLKDVLEIATGETHAIPVSNSESYDGIRWEDSGCLELGTDSTIELSGISN